MLTLTGCWLLHVGFYIEMKAGLDRVVHSCPSRFGLCLVSYYLKALLGNCSLASGEQAHTIDYQENGRRVGNKYSQLD